MKRFINACAVPAWLQGCNVRGDVAMLLMQCPLSIRKIKIYGEHDEVVVVIVRMQNVAAGL